MAQHKVVCNSSPLINLSKVQQLPLLKALYGTVCIPEAVRDEVFDRRKNREGIDALQHLYDQGILDVRTVHDQHLVQAFRKDADNILVVIIQSSY